MSRERGSRLPESSLETIEGIVRAREDHSIDMKEHSLPSIRHNITSPNSRHLTGYPRFARDSRIKPLNQLLELYPCRSTNGKAVIFSNSKFEDSVTDRSRYEHRPGILCRKATATMDQPRSRHPARSTNRRWNRCNVPLPRSIKQSLAGASICMQRFAPQ